MKYYAVERTGPYLAHHGILGQKWGIRRFQNKDGSLTSEGRKRRQARDRIIRSESSTKDIDDIINGMNKVERDYVLAGSDHYLNRDERSTIAKRVVIRDKSGKTVSFFDMLEDGDNLQVALGTRTGSDYRGHGYASKAAERAMKYLIKNKDKIPQRNIVWGVNKNNTASVHLAEKYGFTLDPDSESDDGSWVNYVRRIH